MKSFFRCARAEFHPDTCPTARAVAAVLLLRSLSVNFCNALSIGAHLFDTQFGIPIGTSGSFLGHVRHPQL
jgi:hypothetical protein